MKLINLMELKKLIEPVARSQKQAFDPSILQSVWYPPLCDYTCDEIAYGIQQELKTSKFNMKPAGIIDHLRKGLGHPPAHVAWSYCLHDHISSGWITDTIIAAYGMCEESYRDGDKIGAKQIFLQAYDQQVSIAEAASIPAKWFWSGVSEGLQKTEASIKLVNLGHMPKSRAVAVIRAEEWKHQDIPRYIQQLKPPQKQIVLGSTSAMGITHENG